MCMHLKHHSTRTHHLPSLASLIARRTYLLKPAMGSRQGVHFWQRTLSGGSPGPIHVNHKPRRTSSVKQATGRRKRSARQQILLKKRAEGLHRGLIEGSEK